MVARAFAGPSTPHHHLPDVLARARRGWRRAHYALAGETLRGLAAGASALALPMPPPSPEPTTAAEETVLAALGLLQRRIRAQRRLLLACRVGVVVGLGSLILTALRLLVPIVPWSLPPLLSAITLLGGLGWLLRRQTPSLSQVAALLDARLTLHAQAITALEVCSGRVAATTLTAGQVQRAARALEGVSEQWVLPAPPLRGERRALGAALLALAALSLVSAHVGAPLAARPLALLPAARVAHHRGPPPSPPQRAVAAHRVPATTLHLSTATTNTPHIGVLPSAASTLAHPALAMARRQQSAVARQLAGSTGTVTGSAPRPETTASGHQARSGFTPISGPQSTSASASGGTQGKAGGQGNPSSAGATQSVNGQVAQALSKAALSGSSPQAGSAGPKATQKNQHTSSSTQQPQGQRTKTPHGSGSGQGTSQGGGAGGVHMPNSTRGHNGGSLGTGSLGGPARSDQASLSSRTTRAPRTTARSAGGPLSSAAMGGSGSVATSGRTNLRADLTHGDGAPTNTTAGLTLVLGGGGASGVLHDAGRVALVHVATGTAGVGVVDQQTAAIDRVPTYYIAPAANLTSSADPAAQALLRLYFAPTN